MTSQQTQEQANKAIIRRYRDMDLRLADSITRRYMFGPITYFGSFIAAFINAWASVFICVALAIYFALPHNAKPS